MRCKKCDFLIVNGICACPEREFKMQAAARTVPLDDHQQLEARLSRLEGELKETHTHCEQLRQILHDAECEIDPSVDERLGCNPEIELQAIIERLRKALAADGEGETDDN